MQNLNDYLLSRGISPEIAQMYGLKWNGSQIVIPVFFHEPGGKVCFYKYRKDPNNTDKSVAKYTYETGSYARLYNEHTIKEFDRIIITEGELDTLMLITAGYASVSSTGGSGTFKREWVHQLMDKEVFIVFDTDDAGVKGAIKVQQLLPHAKIVWLPKDKNIKDVTDYMKTLNFDPELGFNKLLLNAQSYNIPLPLDYDKYPKTKAGLIAKRKEYQALINVYKQQKSIATARNTERYYFDGIIAELQRQIEPIERKISALKNAKKGYVNANQNDEISVEKARQVKPIDIHDFNEHGFAHCLWHSEKTPSLKYFHTTNTMYCFGGCGSKDVIDLMMVKNNINFKEAIERLSNMQ